MNKNRRRTEALKQLIPLESYRSPLIPTRLPGRPVLLAAAAPRHVSMEVSEPAWWYLVDPVDDRLLTYSESGIISLPTLAFSMTIQSVAVEEAFEILDVHEETAQEAFFASADADPERFGKLLMAYRAAVPAGLWTWLAPRCADYLLWLAGNPASESGLPTSS